MKPCIVGCMSVALAVFCGCSSSSSPAPAGPGYVDVNSTYSFPVAVAAGNDSLIGRMNLRIVQDGGSLSGTDSLTGVFNGGTPVLDAGTLTGTITPGTDPTINLALTPSRCPSVHEAFSGSEQANVLTVTGLYFVLNADCSVAAVSTMTLPVIGLRPIA